MWAAAVTGTVAILTGALTLAGTLLVPTRQAKEARDVARRDRQRQQLETLGDSLTAWASKLTELARRRTALHRGDATKWNLDVEASAAEQMAYYAVLSHATALPRPTP